MPSASPPPVKVRRFLSPLRWPLLFVFIGCLAWFGYCFYRSFRAVEMGEDYPPAEHERWLSEELRACFGWTALPPSSVDHVWANGFQDHIWLFRLHLSPRRFSDLRTAVLAAHGPHVTVDDRDDLHLCPFDFATPAPQGPRRMHLPVWWEAASLQHFDGLLWDSSAHVFWFGYDPERQLLFLLTYHF